MPLTLADLVDALEVADDPIARKRLKAAIYALADPDPLTVEPDATGSPSTGGSEAPDLHDQHPLLGDVRGRVACALRRLDPRPVVRRHAFGG